MPTTPSGPQTGVKYTLVGPDGTKAVFNESSDPNFVGYITEITGLDSPEVRENAETITGSDGGIHGNFYYGRRPITISGSIINPVSTTDRNEKITKLLQASNAMRADAVLEWTPSGGEAQFVNVRRSQPTRVTGNEWTKSFQISMTSADPRIYAKTLSTAEVEISEAAAVTSITPKEPTAVAVNEQGTFVFVISKAESKIYSYKRNAETGALTLADSKTTGTTTGPIALVVLDEVETAGIYVLNATTATVAKFEYNRSTGVMTAIGTAAAVGEEPVAMAAINGTLENGSAIAVANKKGKSLTIFKRNATTGDLVLRETATLTQEPTDICVPLNPESTPGQSPLYALFGVVKKIGMYILFSGGAKAIELQKISAEALEASPLFIEAARGGILSTYTLLIIGYKDHLQTKVISGASNEAISEVSANTKLTKVELPGASTVTAGIFTEYNYFTEKPMMFYALSESGVYQFAIVGNLHNVSTGGATYGPAPKEPELVPVISGRLIASVEPFVLTHSVYVLGGTAAGKLFEGEATRGSPVSSLHFLLGGAISPNNKGSMETFPVLRLLVTGENAKIVNPTIVNSATNQSISFKGEFTQEIVLDMLNRTATQADGSSIYSTLNFESSEWFPIIPGVNELRVQAESVKKTIKLKAEWRSAWV